MTLDNCFYIEYLGIEAWFCFRGWRESMTGIYLTRELGMCHLNIQVSYVCFGELNCNIKLLISFALVKLYITQKIVPPHPHPPNLKFLKVF
jgi:hypothetical protein